MTPHPQASEHGCPACGGPVVPWRSVRGWEPSDPTIYELSRCTACGTAVTRAAAAADAYEKGLYAPEAPRAAGPVRGLIRIALRQVLGWLRAAGLARGARVVDAGAGPGLLVELMRDSGYDAYGIEQGRRGVARAEAAGRPVRLEAIEEHAAEGVDAAVLWHVLEHVSDPAAALARVRTWLRPGGLLLTGVPNVASLQARIAGAEWFHLDVPRHRTHFTAAGLRALFDRAGFEVVGEHHFVAQHNPLGMWFALLTRLGMTPGFPVHLLKRSVRPSARDLGLLFVAGLPLAIVAVPLEAAAAAARRGGTVALVAQSRS